MKTKTLFSALLSLCLFFAFSASSAYADDWAGYQRIARNRFISLYVKVEHSAHGDSTVSWRGVNHTREDLHVKFRPAYYGEKGDFTSYISGPVFSKGTEPTYLGVFRSHGKGLGRITDIDIFELNISEGFGPHGDVIYSE